MCRVCHCILFSIYIEFTNADQCSFLSWPPSHQCIVDAFISGSQFYSTHSKSVVNRINLPIWIIEVLKGQMKVAGEIFCSVA